MLKYINTCICMYKYIFLVPTYINLYTYNVHIYIYIFIYTISVFIPLKASFVFFHFWSLTKTSLWGAFGKRPGSKAANWPSWNPVIRRRQRKRKRQSEEQNSRCDPSLAALRKPQRSKTTSWASCLQKVMSQSWSSLFGWSFFPNKWWTHVGVQQDEGWFNQQIARIGDWKRPVFPPLYALEELLQVHCTGIIFPSRSSS